MEQLAQDTIMQHLSIDAPSYEDVKNKCGFTGYMDVYLQYSRNVQTMSSTADYDVMLLLAFIDELRDYKTIFTSFLKL